MPRRKQEKTKGPEIQPATGESSRITPVEIQQKEFGLAFRGYNERDVDQFLDEVTEEVARLYAENKRLREELEFARTSRLDLGGAEEADALPRQAREEAAPGAALQEAAAPRKPEPHQPEDDADDLEDERSGPATQPWVPEELHSSSPQDWREYYSSPESREEEAAGAPDEILDLTHEARHPDPDRPETVSGDERDEPEPESVRRRLEPQGAAREADPPEDDSIEDRSIRELFWGDDY